jgi:mannose-1-phosphate guanylyltransferase
MTYRLCKAFVLGAGLGTRLRPLTDVLPKPLLPIFGKPLITFALDHLAQLGIDKVWINTHQLQQKFKALVCDRHDQTVELVFEPQLLETGGGIKNLESKLGGGTFIVYSGDILTDVAVERLLEAHFGQQNDVTLALRSTGISSAVRWCSKSGRILELSGSMRSDDRYDFAGISIWNPSVFARIPERTKISFVPILADWVKEGGKIGGVLLEENYWFNVGRRDDYLRLHQIIASQRWLPRYVRNLAWPVRIEPSANVSPKSRIVGASYVGEDCQIAGGVLIEDSILLPGSSVRSGVSLRSCIVAGTEVLAGNHVGTDFV